MAKPTTKWTPATNSSIDETSLIVDESGNFLADESGNNCLAYPVVYTEKKTTEWTDG